MEYTRTAWIAHLGNECVSTGHFEFSQRPDGWPAAQKAYNFAVDPD